MSRIRAVRSLVTFVLLTGVDVHAEEVDAHGSHEVTAVRELLAADRVQEAVAAALQLPPDSEMRRDAAALFRGSQKYQGLLLRQDAIVKKAMAAVKKGRLDEARLLFDEASALPTLEPPDRAQLNQLMNSLAVPDMRPRGGASSGTMGLREFGDHWAGVLRGSEELVFDLASYAKTIQHERLCDNDLDAFEREDCATYKKLLRQAISDGYRRRFVVAHPHVEGDYVIRAGQWALLVPLDFRSLGSVLFPSPPSVCPDRFLGGTTFCSDPAKPYRFSVPMPPADARPVAKTFPGSLTATVVGEVVSEGSRVLVQAPVGLMSGSKGPVWYGVYRVVGIKVQDGVRVLVRTGVFAP